MKKSKQHYLSLAIVKTMLTGIFYCFMPLLASLYHAFIGDEAFNRYFGYAVLGGGVMILGSVILLCWAWAKALDKDIRRAWEEED